MSDRSRETFGFDELLHSAQAFNNPKLANDPALTINEKRAIRASWASDEASSFSGDRPGYTRTLDRHPWLGAVARAASDEGSDPSSIKGAAP